MRKLHIYNSKMAFGLHFVNDIATSEDILGEIILYKTLLGNIFVYYIMSALYFYIILS